ncbi:hypothetical protein ACQQ9V_07790 [Hornefia butyriciproducens]|uniref:hypothetical protein n=1 Tax=Hornefia butyriciproducens TaxID=2652293 RepID=UPI002A75C245|nr:hypothetical protein [Hornefia butyriciproducens]MCI7326045.1 hypothetical protein [Clostridiales bacterium]MDY2991900.1 hypothetical protein [Hornefia butyriciproducens]
MKIMKILLFLLDYWFLLLIAGIVVGGLVYRLVTKQPVRGSIPPVGVANDLPGSVTGMNKPEELDAMNVRMPAPDEDEYYDKHHLWIDR